MIVEKVRRITIKYHLGIFAGISFLFFSCTKDKVVADSIKDVKKTYSAQMNMTNLSPKDLFMGLIFANGPLVNIIPELQSTKEVKDLYITEVDQIQQEAILQKLVIDNISKSNPDFFFSFKTEITSGDHQRIAYALDNATKLTFSTICNIYGLGANSKDFVNGQLNTIDQDKFVELERINDDLKSGSISKDEAIQHIANVFPDLPQTMRDGLKNMSSPGGPYSPQCLALAIVLVIAVVVAGYVALALALHTVLAARYYVEIDVNVNHVANSPYSNIPLVLVDQIATILH
ncbi:MAG: hypothetical protein WC756_06310 [Taibaiella sp.]|jgi:SdpC family antimicrobial peptide